MQKVLPIDSINKTYRNPVILKCVRTLLNDLGVDPSFHLEIKDFTLKNWNSGDQSQTEDADNREKFIIGIEDNRENIGDLELNFPSNRTLPLFYDNDLGLRIVPIYAKHNLSVTITLSTTSKSTVMRLKDILDVRIRRGSTSQVSALGTYDIPDFIFELLKDINSIKNLFTEQEDDIDYIGRVGTERLKFKSNQKGIGQIVAEEIQHKIGLTLTNQLPDLPDFDNKTNLFTYSFDVKVDMRRPKAILVEYEPLIYNTFLNEKYLGVSKKISDLEARDYYYKLLLSELESGKIVSEQFNWSVVNGVVDEGPFTGLVLENYYDNKVSGYYLNNVVYGGFLDGYIFGDAVGGVYVGEYYEDNNEMLFEGMIIGGHLDGKYIDTIVKNGTPVTGDFDLISRKVLSGEFKDYDLREKQKPLRSTIDPLDEIIDNNTFLSKNIANMDLGRVDDMLAYPIYDTPPRFDSNSGYLPMLSLLLQIEDRDTQTMFNLGNLGMFDIEPDLLSIVRDISRNKIFINYKAPILLEFFSGTTLLSPSWFSIDEDLNITCSAKLDMTGVYRCRISMLTDYSMIPPDEDLIKRLTDLNYIVNLLRLSDTNQTLRSFNPKPIPSLMENSAWRMDVKVYFFNDKYLILDNKTKE